MAKINVPKSFDKGQLPGKVLTDLEPFIDYVNQNFEQTTSALRNALTFADNVKCVIKTLSVKHLQPFSVNLGNVNFVGLQVINSTGPIRSFEYTQSQGLFLFTFRFDEPITIGVKSIALASAPATGFFTVETNDVLRGGDLIRLSSYSAGGTNNGDFLVSRVYTTTPRKVSYHNPDGVAEGRDSYSTTSPQSRDVTIAFLTA